MATELDKLKSSIVDDHSDFVTSKWVLERIPFLFQDDLDLYIDWKERLSNLIEVDARAITITGSAAAGYSLNPDKNFRKFTKTSDIDVAVVSDYYFNVSWHYLRNLGPLRHSLNVKEKSSLEDHRKRLVYWGTIATDKIVQILPFGTKWIAAMEQMRKINPTIDRDINFRIYKDYESLREYQTNCISKLKDKLIVV